ncbi:MULTISPECIES: hypothetical protein [unclassified Yoonia]|uniref:hypothetical protein n=1 Tax=unclassified Yoonia TaxID=2629118 RepID=UPI002AFE3BC4|nr:MULTISPECIES: hypothetical protein [unclassified Yoonia]
MKNSLTHSRATPFFTEIVVGKIMPNGGGLAFFEGDQAAYITPAATSLLQMKAGDTFNGLIVENRSAGSVPWFVQHVSPSGTKTPDGLDCHIMTALKEYDALDLDALTEEVAITSCEEQTPIMSAQVRAVAEALFSDGKLNKVIVLSKISDTEVFFTAIPSELVEITAAGVC